MEVIYLIMGHSHFKRGSFLSKIQQNSINLTCTGPDRCQITKYSRLRDGTCTDLSCYRQFYVTVLYWAAQLIRGVLQLDISFIC
jgi:hypothetical protein